MRLMIRFALLVAGTLLVATHGRDSDITAQGSAAGASSSPGGGFSSSPVSDGGAGLQSARARSAKRGVAYDFADAADLEALSPGVSWWYNWSTRPGAGVQAGAGAGQKLDFYPMIWGAKYDVSAIEKYLVAHREIKYLLVMNEPSLPSQADLTPQQAAGRWPDFEAISARTGVKLVGPAVTWGTMRKYTDPVDWLDAFYVAYEAAHGNRPPQIDYLAFHWYDYGLAQQLDRLVKYGKQIWITELANWHARRDGGQIDTLAKQEAQMRELVALCESRADVFRYAWFTGRMRHDVHYVSLLGAPGELTELGRLYVSLPYASP
jgi:hypothetical protein